jgi:hypothetical protein
MERVKDLVAWNKAMTDKVTGPKIIAYAKRSGNEDILKFLTLMRAGKKGQNEYDLFIKPRSKYEINIDSDLRDQFTKIAQTKPKPDWAKAPWAKATTEMLNLFNDNISPKIV